VSVGWFVQVITFSCGPRHQRATRYGEERGKIYVICPDAATRKVRGGYSAFPDTMLVGSAPGGSTPTAWKYWTTAGSIHRSTAQQTSSNPDCSKNNQPRRNQKGKDPNNKARHSVQSTVSSNHPWTSDFPQTKLYRNEQIVTSLKFEEYKKKV